MSSRFWLRLRFGPSARILFYESLRDKVRDGLAVYEVIRRIEVSASLFKVFPVGVLRDIMSSMRGSQRKHDASLGAALRPWVPSMESAMISAGERAGRIDVALHEAAQLMHAHSRVRGLVASKLSYPLLLMLLLTGLLAALGAYLVPLLEQMLPRDKWPGIAQAIGFLADHSTAIAVSFAATLAAYVGVFLLSARNWVGPARDFFDRYAPLWSQYRHVQGALMLMTISMLTASGVPMSAAIEVVRSNSSAWMAAHMSRIMLRMRSGHDDGFALAGDGGSGTLFDPYTAWQISLYNSNTMMANKLRSLSETSTARVQSTIGKASALLQAFVMSMVAALLILTYVSYMTVTSIASGGGIL